MMPQRNAVFPAIPTAIESSAPEEFGQFPVSEMHRWKGLVKKAP